MRDVPMNKGMVALKGAAMLAFCVGLRDTFCRPITASFKKVLRKDAC